MGLFSWLLGKKRNNAPLRQYLGSDVEPESEKPKKKARRAKKKTPEENDQNIERTDIPLAEDVEKELVDTERASTEEK